MKRARNPLKADPTRTATLRRRFQTDVRKRFARLATKVVQLVDKDDVFGLKPKHNRPYTFNVFCPTGPGGGVDPTCSPDGSSGDASVRKAADKLYPKSTDKVDGREVLKDVPNQSSIESSVNDPLVLPGIREVQISQFEGLSGKSYSVSETERIRKLADDIKQSNQISPLIVVDDGHGDGPYILEGGHRAEALYLLGAKSFPAMVVLDLDELSSKEIPSRLWGNSSNEELPRQAGENPAPPIFNEKKYSSTQANITDRLVIDEVARLQSLLDKGDVLELETKPHITVLYGLHTEDYEDVAPILDHHGIIYVELQTLSLFQSEEQDVLKFDVKSPGLQRLYDRLCLLDHTSNYDEYHPHLTVAYLKPGTGHKYLDLYSKAFGRGLLIKEVAFSTPEREQTELAINVFCPTGPGGGVDPTCSPDTGDGGGGAAGEHQRTKQSVKVKGTKVEVLINPTRAQVERLDKAGRHHSDDIGVRLMQHPITLDIYAWDANLANHEDIVKGMKMTKELDEWAKQSDEDWFSYSPSIDEASDADSYVEWYDEFRSRQKNVQNELTINQRWRFLTNPQKIQAFQVWLQTQVKLNVIPDNQPNDLGDVYWERYVQEGFRKGAGRAFDDTRKGARALASGNKGKLDFYRGTQYEFLRSSFGKPETVEKVKLLAGRVFTDLKGVTEAMSTQMSRTLTDGLVQGKNPRDIAKDLTKVISSIGKTRANTIARTEIIRAHAEGQLDALEQLGVEEVGVAVEWSTAGDERVCPECEPLEGVVLKVSEAHGLLPRHPNCRCSFIPANVGEPSKEQKRTITAIRAAVKRSVKAEGRSLKGSKWVGADQKFAKRRPKSLVN